MKAAVIGCGRMGAEPSARLEGRIPAGWLPMSHAESLQAMEGVELAALCDTNDVVLRQRGDHYGVGRLYTNFRQLIDDVRPDLVTVATRTPPKKEIIEYACRGGVRGIYVEKPLANSMEDAMRILETVERCGVKLVYGVNRRYHAVYRYARDLVLKGIIGDVVEIVVEHGRAQLLWSHPHTVDLLLFFAQCSQVSKVQASLTADTVARSSALLIDSDPVIDHAFFQFGNGVTASILRTGGLNVRVAGTSGMVVVHADGTFLEVNKSCTAEPAYYLDHSAIHQLPCRGATVTALGELCRSVVAHTLPPITLSEIETGTRMLMACVWSHLEEGRPIDPGEVPSNLVVTGKFGSTFA